MKKEDFLKQRSSGIICPLFSIMSKNSIGIGEFRDLKLVIDWCKNVGYSVLQLLPLNEIGFDFSPYSSISSFAIDPLYLSLDNIIGSSVSIIGKICEIKKNFDKNFNEKNNIYRVNYSIKNEKLLVLKYIFDNDPVLDFLDYQNYKEKNANWLDDYALFKALKDVFNQDSWENWQDNFKNRINLETFSKENSKSIEFYKWLQWQIFVQFKEIFNYAHKNSILLMGDVPFLVSRDSSDVWGKNREIFDLNKIAGCPPDAYNAFGQKWGMPPYNWENLEKKKYQYFLDKFRYMENFYDIYRIDHALGAFKLWTIDKNEPDENVALNGKFSPNDENLWEEHGRKILSIIKNSNSMIPTAEDLGVVPSFVSKVLKDMNILGIEVGRWAKNRENETKFKSSDDFKELSVVMSSGHDMSNTLSLWKFELGTIDETRFYKILKDHNVLDEKIEVLKKALFLIEKSKYGRLLWKNEIYNLDILKDILSKVLNLNKENLNFYELYDEYKETYNEKYSFYVTFLTDKNEYQPNLLDYLHKKTDKEAVCDMIYFLSKSKSLLFLNNILDVAILENIDRLKDEEIVSMRINTPGTISDKNWSIMLPFYTDKLKNLKINDFLLETNIKTNRYNK